MGFFSKHKEENNGFIINTDDEAIKISGDKNLAPHAMTPSEVSTLWVLGDDEPLNTNTGALDALKKRMNVTNDDTNATDEKAVATPVTEKKESEQKPTIIPTAPVENETTPSLVEKVKRYTIDEHGHDVSENREPLYQLESVAEILKSDSEDALKELSKKYGIQIDDSSKSKPKKAVEEPTPTPTKAEKLKKTDTQVFPTPAFEQMVSDAEKREAKELYESLFPSDKEPKMLDISVPDISDIDTHEVGISTDTTAATGTIRFTPVTNSKGNTDHITISSVTKQIDLEGHIPEDISSHSGAELEESEFDNFEPSAEYKDTASGKKLLRKAAQKKRKYFLSSFVSALMLIALSFFRLPFIYNSMLSNPKSTTFACTALLGVSMLANTDMFLNFKNLFKKSCSFDILASLCTASTIGFGIAAAVTDSDGAYYIILLCAFILLVRSLCKFRYASAQYTSLRAITNDKIKNAVTLISDPATTFAMAKDSIEGDVLIAAHKKSAFIEDFMKHFEFYKTLSGKVSTLFFVTLALEITGGIIAYFYFGNIFESFYTAAAVTCIAAMPSVFFIDSLPFSSAAKKLSTKGAMLAGIHGAQRIENANAAVIKTDDLFPEGTVVMHNMKVLSNNSIDKTILRAAALTAAVGSPLESIFKQIAGTNETYSIPDADTIKYEKNLGISGWVDNEPLFIGNRSLMRAHGINIPSLEVDKKILRKGFFPVYVATSDTACALIVIQYNVDPVVAKEIHKISDLGVLLLIENCDPNVTEEMICDYFGLYEGSVKVMSNVGVHMYKNAVPDVISCSAAASYKGSGLNFVRLINCASSVKSANRLLTIIYATFAIIGILYFVYAAFSGVMSIPSPTTVLIYAFSTFVLSIIGFLIRKP